MRLWLSLIVVAFALANPAGTAQDLRFKAEAKGLVFDTGVVRGQIAAEGKLRGLSGVTHVPTGARLDSSMGLFSHYRIFTANHRFGTAAWDWPAEVSVTPEGAVELRCPAAPDHPFDLTLRYQWMSPTVLDLITTVVARTNLPGFDVFMASYFASDFTNSRVWAPGPSSEFRPVVEADGVWQVFPFRTDAAKLLTDGRWKIEPHPVDWALIPGLKQPVAFRFSPRTGIGVAVMAEPSETFALFSPHQTEGHYSIYFSFFGRDLAPTQTARVRCRLEVLSPFADPASVVAAWNTFRKAPPTR